MANQTVQLAELLRGEGLNVTVVQTNAAYRPRWIARVHGVRAAFRLVPFVVRLWRAAGAVDLFHVMANSGLSWHLFAAPAIVVARMRRIPVVINYRGGEADAFLARSRAAVRLTMDRADAIAVPSAYLHEVLARHGVASRIVANIVDPARFAPKARDGAVSGSCHVVVARNLEALYDVASALRAIALVRQTVPGAQLSVAGSGPELDTLRALARELDIEDAVTFTGRLDREEMAALYRHADLMLNPSRVDNLPNSVLEALACGLPVVTTNVGGVPYVVAHEKTAILVDPGNYEAMARAIVRLRSEPQLAQSLVEAGLAEVQRYSWPRVREALLALYDEIALGHRSLTRTATR
jgi:glycosyltransferase involved in cell wall biosynthesis